MRSTRHKRVKVKGSLLSNGVLATQMTAENFQKCHDQSQSPLFSVLPPELRNVIFELATSSYDDPRNQYETNDFCYRPEYPGRQVTSLSLLGTCRRVWLEANAWPVMQARIPAFWFKDLERRPRWTRVPQRVRGTNLIQEIPEEVRMMLYFSKLTDTAIAKLKTFRVFAQMYWLENDFCNISNFGNTRIRKRRVFSPPILIVTIRHTDWWYWEEDDRLELKSDWLHLFLSASNANHPIVPRTEFRLELETLDYKVSQLLDIIQQIRRRWASLEYNTPWELQADSGKQTSAWSGPTNIGGYDDYLPYVKLDKLEYRVFTLVWCRRSTLPVDQSMPL